MFEAILLIATATNGFCGSLVNATEEAKVQAPPVGYKGIIVATGDDWVELDLGEGKIVKVAMTPDWLVSTPRATDMRELGLGDFVASANANVEAGKGTANELRIFEPGYLPEFGTHAMQAPNTSMTHGFVFGVADAGGSNVLEVHYPGGCRVIDIPKDIKVTTYDILGRQAALPGTRASVVTRKSEDGVMRAGRVVIDR